MQGAIKPDVIVCWLRHRDYPLWQAFIRQSRGRFKAVIVVFSNHHFGDDYRTFIKEAMAEDSVTFLDRRETIGGEDWRDVAMNEGLSRSESDWIWFTEQDFIPKKGFWEALNDARFDGYEVMATYFDGHTHPCNIFIKRETLMQKSSRNFAAIPGVSDHFETVRRELGETETPVFWFPGDTYHHYAGLSHNIPLLSDGTGIAVPAQEPRGYLAQSLEASVPLDPRFLQLALKCMGGEVESSA